MELTRAGVVAAQVQWQMEEAIACRIPLLGSDTGRLKQQIVELEVEFEQDCFDRDEQTLGDRIKTDINSRWTELNNLARQKEVREVDKEREIARLEQLGYKLSSTIAPFL